MLTFNHDPMDDRIYFKEALSLAKQYREISIVAPNIEDRVDPTGRVSIVGFHKPPGYSGLAVGLKNFAAAATGQKADIYHTHDFQINYVIRHLRARNPRARFINDVHEHYPDMFKDFSPSLSSAKRLWISLLDRLELSRAKRYDLIITADDAIHARFQGVVPNLSTIYNYSDFEPRTSGIETEEWRKREFDLVYCGAITRLRGAMVILRAVGLLKNRLPELRTLFVGPVADAAFEQEMRGFVRDQGLSQNVTFQGAVPHDEVYRHLERCRIGLVPLLPIPKYKKNISMKQFEYMAAGLPMVGSDLPPIAGCLRPERVGILVEAGRARPLAEAVGHLLGNPDEAVEMGNRGPAAVRERYHWRLMEEKLLVLYSNLSSSGSPTGSPIGSQ